MLSLIHICFFIMENVKGIMSSPLKHVPIAERNADDPEQQLGTVLDVILSEFNKLDVYKRQEEGLKKSYL